MGVTLNLCTPKARKEHRCDGCECTIEPGTVYHKWAWCDGCSMTTVKVCDLCWDVLNNKFDDEEWYVGELKQLHPKESEHV